jgi:hypothetical protein
MRNIEAQLNSPPVQRTCLTHFEMAELQSSITQQLGILLPPTWPILVKLWRKRGAARALAAGAICGQIAPEGFGYGLFFL